MEEKNEKVYEILSLDKSIRKDRAKEISTIALTSILSGCLFAISLKTQRENLFESITTLLGTLCILCGGSTNTVQYEKRIKENKQKIRELMK